MKNFLHGGRQENGEENAYRAGARARIRVHHARGENPPKNEGFTGERRRKRGLWRKKRCEKFCGGIGRDLREFLRRAGAEKGEAWWGRGRRSRGRSACETPSPRPQRGAGRRTQSGGGSAVCQPAAGSRKRAQKKPPPAVGQGSEMTAFYLWSGVVWAESTRFSALVTRLSSEVANSG